MTEQRTVNLPPTHKPCPTHSGYWFHASTGACSCGASHKT